MVCMCEMMAEFRRRQTGQSTGALTGALRHMPADKLDPQYVKQTAIAARIRCPSRTDPIYPTSPAPSMGPKGNKGNSDMGLEIVSRLEPPP
jgi:hypothetical protein